LAFPERLLLGSESLMSDSFSSKASKGGTSAGSKESSAGEAGSEASRLVDGLSGGEQLIFLRLAVPEAKPVGFAFLPRLPELW
jgi:hypothetical protein